MTTPADRNKKLSRARKPEGMSLEDWQVELRRQFGRDQNFEAKNIGHDPVFSEFKVHNPQSGNTYRVAIRGRAVGQNYCSCPDFETNHLGTCKHVEWLLSHLENKRGGRAALNTGFQPPYSEIFLQYGAERKVVFRAGTECPPELATLAARYFTDDVLQPESFGKFQTFLTKAGEFEHELRCYDDVLAFIAEVRDESQRKKHLADIFPVGHRSANLKNLLRVPLYRYQREGALFAAKAGRCLIGDEMGLGKTVQALAAAEIMATEFGVEKVLIVCPTSLKHQWQREIERFTHRSAIVIDGLQPQRERLYAEDSFYKIVNYDVVLRDLPLIEKLAPDLVVLDEAQRIKNWDTLTARSVKRIDSPYAIVLTGTPLENRLEELVSIVQFVDRHRLGPTYRFLHEHQQHDENGRVIGYTRLDEVGRTLEPIFLRRTKEEVLDELPERIEKNYFVSMTEPQWELHSQNRETVARIVQRWRKLGFLREPDQRRLMIALQNMRMSCNSTYLLDHETDYSVKPDELVSLLSDLFETPGTKAVVFSQWTRTHELVVRRLKDVAYRHVFFHGGVASKRRRDLVNQFRDDPDCRLFLSTDAGGVGLNLQNATVVVNLDIPWNPAILEQRIGRVHRLGQTRPVQVINLIAEATIEEGMLQTLAFKKDLFEGVLDGGQSEVFLGESRFKQFMSAVESVTDSIPTTPPPTTEPDEPKAPGRPKVPSAIPAGPPSDPLAGLIQNGLALLQQLASAAHTNGQAADENEKRPAIETIRDETTGQNYVKIPLPEPQVVEDTLALVTQLLDRWRSR